MSPEIHDPVVCVQNLEVVYPNGNGGLQALGGVSLEVCPQEFVCVLGPSGSGKSTLLRVLAGLLAPTRGEVIFSHLDEVGRKPRIGLVFQQANLMPWRTVRQNITLPLELKGTSSAGARAQAQQLIELEGLQGFEDSWLGDLSGGKIGRAHV